MNQRNFELAKALRRKLHRHPELSNQEVFTKKLLMDFINTHTSLDVEDRGPWFYVVYRAGSDKPNIAFRADFDAVAIEEGIDIPHGSIKPGTAHKCGHDGHAASLAAFALEVDQKGADKNIYFLFQHAEETGDGASQCVPFIYENHIEEIFACHNMSGLPFKSVNVIEGTSNCASKGMTIRITGTPAHASQPETGANPAFAIARIINAIPEFLSPELNKGMVLCTVIQVDIGEKAFGISAGRGDLLLTIRALYEDDLVQLQNNLEKMAWELAVHDGLQVAFYYDDVFPVTKNHPRSVEKIRRAARSEGFQVLEIKEALRGSEDFGHYLKHTQGAICYLGNGEDYPHVHTTGFDYRDELIETTVSLFMSLAKM